MSIALKKQQFKTQIRRETLRKILQQKKLIFQTQNQVNQTFINYINKSLKQSFPKICALKFQFLTQDNKHLLIKLVRQRQIKLNFSKPHHILLINKISLIEKEILSLFIQEVTSFADKLIFLLSGNQNLQNNNSQKSFPQPSPEMLENLKLFPNCFLQFWANFFAISEQGLQINTYCVVLKAFIYWFGSKSTFFKYFNKYSFCLFMKNFMKFQNILSFERNYQSFKPIQELYIKFRIHSIPILGILLEEGFLNDDFLEILSYVAENQCQNNLLRSLSCRNQKKVTFFTHLMKILEDQSYLERKINKSQILFSQGIEEDQLRKFAQYSIQSTQSEDLAVDPWKRKVKILNLMNDYLSFQEYQLELLKGDLKLMTQRLFCIYVYCQQRGQITQKIQHSICILVFNIITLVQSALDLEIGDMRKQLQIQQQQQFSQKSQQQNQLNAQDQQFQKQIRQTINLLRDYFIDELDIGKIIHKSSFYSSEQIIQLLQLLNEISHFCHNKEIDQRILDSNIIEKICGLFIDQTFNSSQLQLILGSLFEYLSNLHRNNFILSKYSIQLQQFRHPQINQFLTQSQQTLLNEILASFQ